MTQTEKNKLFHQHLNEVMTADQLEYLTVACSTRTKATASRCRNLINAGKYAEALKAGDPIGYTVSYREYWPNY